MKSQNHISDLLHGTSSTDQTSGTGVRKPHDDIEALKQHLRDYQVQNVELAVKYDWAVQVAEIMAQRPHGLLKKWLPFWMWRKSLLRKLKRRNLFDSERYAARYPDIVEAGFDPLSHFLIHGLAEKREGAYLPLPSTSEPGADQRFVDLIIESGFLDTRWYCENYLIEAETDEEVARNYVIQSHQDTLVNPGPLFSGIFYLSQNPDVRGMHPLDHYLRFGLKEGRRAFSPEAADAFLEASANSKIESIYNFIDPSKETVILYWNDGNFFFADIAEYIAQTLRGAGFKAIAQSEDLQLRADGFNFIVVAPHEYCVHGPGRNWSESRYERAIFVNTEQWHTSWFSLALGFIRKSMKAIDINPASARGLSKLGVRSGFFPLLPHQETIFARKRMELSDNVSSRRVVKALTYPGDFAERPYDVLFVATLNERRGKILASLAKTLAEYETYIHCPKLSGPVTAEDMNMIGSGDISQLAANSKILLNLHQGKSRYFEWHRLFLSGICEGCVVVTEPCIDTGILRVGDHYLEASAEALPEYINWLLGTNEGAAKMLHVHRSCILLLSDIMSKGSLA